MGTRGEALADELQQVTGEVATCVEAAPVEVWDRGCVAEQCTVAALACHIADGYTNILDNLVKPIVEGRDRVSARRTAAPRAPHSNFSPLAMGGREIPTSCARGRAPTGRRLG